MNIGRVFPDSNGLVEFSQTLSESDYWPELAAIAGDFGIEGEDFQLDGTFHRPQISDRAFKGRSGYIGEWQTSPRGIRYPTATFSSKRQGGISERFDGYPVLLELYRGRANSTPRPAPVRRPPRPTVDAGAVHRQVERRRAKLRQLWAESLPGHHPDAEPLRKYLANRGLACIVDRVIPNSIRLHGGLEYRHRRDSGEWVSLGEHPAMVCAVQNLDGIGVNCHRLFLTDDGHKAEIVDPDDASNKLPSKKLMPSAIDGAMRGAAIRLHEAAETLGLVEGVETGLAVHAATGLPVWAAVSAEGMKAVQLPESVRNVTVYGDNDSSGTGQRAAYALSVRLEAEGRRVKVAIPDEPGCDWADVWQRQVREGSTNEEERA